MIIWTVIFKLFDIRKRDEVGGDNKSAVIIHTDGN